MISLRTKDATAGLTIAAPIELSTKELTEAGEFEGYASTFGNVDRGGDMMMAGAFLESLGRRPAGKVKMLRDHDTRKIIGVWTEAKEDGRGLYMKGRLILDTEGGREAYALLKAGALDSLSIGYRVLADSYQRDANGRRDVRQLIKVDLMEVSLVTFPMNEAATISRVKGRELPTERELEAALRDAGLSASEAKALIAGRAYKSILNARDAGTGDDKSGDALDALRTLARTLRGGG
ncbi:HK97 family phage prohead protease [Salinarimonas sp. NSM]|uniref:HK97 family phage prohead protease n=1 Tax=Salinarimonas sp. NSM TaxID=3458003 RepID=UPI004037254E